MLSRLCVPQFSGPIKFDITIVDCFELIRSNLCVFCVMWIYWPQLVATSVDKCQLQLKHKHHKSVKQVSRVVWFTPISEMRSADDCRWQLAIICEYTLVVYGNSKRTIYSRRFTLSACPISIRVTLCGYLKLYRRRFEILLGIDTAFFIRTMHRSECVTANPSTCRQPTWNGRDSRCGHNTSARCN